MIVLFTPVMPQVDVDNGIGRKREDSADPFECFGKRLSERPARIRHVPFLCKVGLTDLHLPWIRQAHAILVIISEPSGATVGDIEASVKSQGKFLAAVSTALRDMRPSDAEEVTLTYVYCGIYRDLQDQDYGNIVQIPSYTRQDLCSAVDLLVGPPGPVRDYDVVERHSTLFDRWIADLALPTPNQNSPVLERQESETRGDEAESARCSSFSSPSDRDGGHDHAAVS